MHFVTLQPDFAFANTHIHRSNNQYAPLIVKIHIYKTYE